MNWKHLTTPLDESGIAGLHSSDTVLLSGIIYAARDRAHDRLCALIADKKPFPFDSSGQLIYYMGPSPAPPYRVIGAAGPTTSYRMDGFTEQMLMIGIKGFIGKGTRGMETRSLLKKYRAVYFSTFGGAAAYLSKRIFKSEIIAFEDLGPEAVFRLEVRDFPVVVINDIYGGDFYERALLA